MRLLTKNELKNEPNGTVYIPFAPEVFMGEINIITGKDGDNEGWNGELPILPMTIKESEVNYATQWCTTDNAWEELDNNTKYAVFSKNEVLKIIQCLQWALTGCKSYFNEDEWWSEYCYCPLTDREMEEDFQIEQGFF